MSVAKFDKCFQNADKANDLKEVMNAAKNSLVLRWFRVKKLDQSQAFHRYFKCDKAAKQGCH